MVFSFYVSLEIVDYFGGPLSGHGVDVIGVSAFIASDALLEVE
jgi:hypothetical protein